MKILNCYDNQGETFDRYTIVFNEIATNDNLLMMLGLSCNPNSAQGFSQWTHGHDGPHLGIKIKFNKLPDHIKKHIKQRIAE